MGVEYRRFTIETRASEASDYIVRGYATTFEDVYILFGDQDYEIREVIDRGALNDAEMNDCILQYNHEGRIFARCSNGTLRLKVDRKGLYIEADLSGTEGGRQLYNEIRGGYTTKMSIGMRVDVSQDVWTQHKEGEKVIETRRVNRIVKLYDVSAVSMPANPYTNISA